MARLWLLRGANDAPGWRTLRTDHESEQVNIVHLDPHVWALVEADQPPSGYGGLESAIPPDGMYLDPNGSPLFVAGAIQVAGAEQVVDRLGPEAERLFETVGDAVSVLERLRRVY